MHFNQVGVWRQRFETDRLAGLLDGDRPGRPPTYGHDDVLLLVKTVTEDPPDGATRWTMEALAARMAEEGVPISPSQAWRICRALDLKPWQVQSWMTSHDPEFWAKAGDVCGLYLNPPQNALVWSVDEKTGIQAKSRINPTRRHVVGEHLEPGAAGGRDRREMGHCLDLMERLRHRDGSRASPRTARTLRCGTASARDRIVTGWPASSSRATTARPTRPSPPVTRMRDSVTQSAPR